MTELNQIKASVLEIFLISPLSAFLFFPIYSCGLFPVSHFCACIISAQIKNPRINFPKWTYLCKAHWQELFLKKLLVLIFPVLGLYCFARIFCSWGAWASHCWGFSLRSTSSRHVGFSSCSTQDHKPWLAGTRVQNQYLWHTGLVARWHVGSSQTREQTCVFCTGRPFMPTAPPEKSLRAFFNTTFHDFIIAQQISLNHFSASLRNVCLILINQFSPSVMSDFLLPHELQHTRPPYPLPTAGVYPNPHPLSR